MVSQQYTCSINIGIGAYHCVGDLQHLLEQRVFLLVSPTRVDDDDLETLVLELVHSVSCDYHGICLRVTATRTIKMNHLDIKVSECLRLMVGPFRNTEFSLL